MIYKPNWLEQTFVLIFSLLFHPTPWLILPFSIPLVLFLLCAVFFFALQHLLPPSLPFHTSPSLPRITGTTQSELPCCSLPSLVPFHPFALMVGSQCVSLILGSGARSTSVNWIKQPQHLWEFIGSSPDSRLEEIDDKFKWFGKDHRGGQEQCQNRRPCPELLRSIFGSRTRSHNWQTRTDLCQVQTRNSHWKYNVCWLQIEKRD